MSDILTEQEVIEWTGYTQTSKQSAALTEKGIFHDIRPNNTVAVCWYHIHHPSGGNVVSMNEPDYSWVNGQKAS